MSEPFELQIRDGGLWMGFRDFVLLVSELESYGVDAEVQAQDERKIRFRLKEAFKE